MVLHTTACARKFDDAHATLLRQPETHNRCQQKTAFILSIACRRRKRPPALVFRTAVERRRPVKSDIVDGKYFGGEEKGEKAHAVGHFLLPPIDSTPLLFCCVVYSLFVTVYFNVQAILRENAFGERTPGVNFFQSLSLQSVTRSRRSSLESSAYTDPSQHISFAFTNCDN